MTADYPLLFERRLLEKVWGARRLEGRFGITLPAGKAIGESWELSDHPSGESAVRNGALAGRTLRSLMAEGPRAIVGNAPLAAGGRFPLLVKFVDSADRLSVQVHPDDAAAARLAARDGGKNEAWFVLHADPGAVLWVGLAEGKGRDDLAHAKSPAEFERLLRAVRPERNDAIALPAGTIHAIGPGFTLCEVQQTSDVTYRVYDWDRPASAARPLHREESFAVARFDARPALHRARSAGKLGSERAELPSPGTFRWVHGSIDGSQDFAPGAAFRIVIALDGKLALTSSANPEETATLRAGEAALLTQAGGPVRGVASPRCEIVEVFPT